jgi:hypothetical protein
VRQQTVQYQAQAIHHTPRHLYLGRVVRYFHFFRSLVLKNTHSYHVHV